MTKVAESPCRLDVPKVKGAIRSIEDRIFITLLTEKGSSKSELAKIINVNYVKRLTLLHKKIFYTIIKVLGRWPWSSLLF